MKSVFSSLVTLVLIASCLAFLVMGANQHIAVHTLAWLAGGTLCVNLIGLIRRGAWQGAAWIVTMAYAVAAEVLLLILPSVRGDSWLGQTGFVGLSHGEVFFLWVIILLPFVLAGRVINR